MVSPIHVSMHIGDGNRNVRLLDMVDSTSATGYYLPALQDTINLKNSTLFHVFIEGTVIRLQVL